LLRVFLSMSAPQQQYEIRLRVERARLLLETNADLFKRLQEAEDIIVRDAIERRGRQPDVDLNERARKQAELEQVPNACQACLFELETDEQVQSQSKHSFIPGACMYAPASSQPSSSDRAKRARQEPSSRPPAPLPPSPGMTQPMTPPSPASIQALEEVVSAQVPLRIPRQAISNSQESTESGDDLATVPSIGSQTQERTKKTTCAMCEHIDPSRLPLGTVPEFCSPAHQEQYYHEQGQRWFSRSNSAKKSTDVSKRA
jgi:hypothetical protein